MEDYPWNSLMEDNGGINRLNKLINSHNTLITAQNWPNFGYQAIEQ